MANIPGLPTVEPVALPQAKPQQFGASAEAVTGLSQEVEQMAAGNQAFEQHLIVSDRYLKVKQAEIAYDATLGQVHEELARAVTPEDAQAVYDRSKAKLAGVLQPFETDRVLSRQLALFGAEQQVQLQNTVNGRKATLIQKGDEQANDLLYKKSLQEGVNTYVGGGDPSVAREQLEQKLNASVHVMGTMMPQQAAAVMQQYDEDFEKGIVEAGTNSPDPAIRKSTIAQLKDGKGLEHLDKATQNALLTKAENRDRELTNLAESQDYNAATNHFDELSKGWSYGDKVKALENGEFLKANGFVDASGQPDRKKADMLLEEADRSELRQRKVTADKDNEIIDKYVDQVDAGKMSDAKIDEVVRHDGGSPKASATLRSVLRQHVREARSDAREARVEANQTKREITENGNGLIADYGKTITDGGSVDPDEVWGKVKDGEMTPQQAKTVLSSYQKAKHEDYKANLQKIQNSVADKAQQGALSQKLHDAVEQQNLQGKAMGEFTDKLLKEHGEQKATGFVQGLWNRLFSGVAVGPPAIPPKLAGTAPKDGATKTNAAGDKVVYRNGKWGPE